MSADTAKFEKRHLL